MVQPRMDTLIWGPLLAKLSKEKKTVFLLGDNNVDLSKYEQHSPTNSKTIIDNIFSNIISTGIISGNLTAKISDNLPQFLIAPEIFWNSPSYFERDWSNFNQENFILDYFSVNWKNVINLQRNDVNHSLQNFFDSVNDLLKIHAPYKKVKKI